MIYWTLNNKSLPLFHIKGELNLADWVTKIKPLALEHIDNDSPWQQGLPWMLLPTDQLPLTPFSELTISGDSLQEISQECHNEPFFLDSSQTTHPILAELFLTQQEAKPVSTAQVAVRNLMKREPFFIDIIGLGWFRTRRRIAAALRTLRVWKHKAIHRTPLENCPGCELKISPDLHEVELEVDAVLFRHESKFIKKEISSKKLQQFVEEEGILYYRGRFSENNVLSKIDLDKVEFLDAPVCLGKKPVVWHDSEIFYAYLVAVHMIIAPHSGNAATARHIANRMFIPHNSQRWIQKLRNDCSKCQIILKKTVEVEMKKHHFARTMIAPVFYNSMMDIAYGFPGQAYLNARKRIDVFALVIVCIFSGATDILALEGLETQNVVRACAAFDTHTCT